MVVGFIYGLTQVRFWCLCFVIALLVSGVIKSVVVGAGAATAGGHGGGGTGSADLGGGAGAGRGRHVGATVGRKQGRGGIRVVVCDLMVGRLCTNLKQ